MPKPHRCYNPNCEKGGDFEADKPECPTCKAPAVELATIHYLANDPVGPIRGQHGNRRVACMPLRAVCPQHATGVREATTCAKCKASALFAEHEEAGVNQHVPAIETKLSEQTGKTVAQG